MGKRQGSGKSTIGVLRAGLFAATVLLPVQTFAGPAEDASAIESLLAAERAGDAEAAARAALKAAQATHGADSLDAANLNRLLGDALYAQDRYAEAEPFFRAALRLRGRTLGDAHADTAQSANDLGLTLRNLGQHDEAVALMRFALDIRVKAFGPEHEAVARSWFALARALESKGDDAAAAQAAGKAAEIGERTLGKTAPTVILWGGEQAAMLHNGGDLAAAETAYLKVLAVAETALPAGDTNLATFRQGLANLYRQTRRPELAEPLHRLALEARRKAHGELSRPVALSLEGLGRSLEAQSRYGEAAEAYRESLGIREQTDGRQSAAAADMHMRLGTVLLGLDSAAEAEAQFRTLLAIHEATSGPVSEGAAHAARNIARAAARQDRNAEAEAYLKRALDISERIHGPDALYTGFDLIFLGMHYSGQQRFREAMPLIERAVAIMDGNEGGKENGAIARAALMNMKFASGARDEAIGIGEKALADLVDTRGARSRDAAKMMVTLAQMHEMTGDHDKAEGLALEARAILEEDGEEDASLTRIASLMGNVKLGQGKPAEAEAYFRDSLAMRTARYGADSTELQTVHADLGKARFVQGDFAGAIAHLERSVALVETIARVDTATAFASRTGEIEDAAVARAAIYDHLVKAYDRQAEQAPVERAAMTEKAFLIAQRVIESQAAGAMAQLAHRQAAGDGALAALVRERQDLVDRWRETDSGLVELLSRPQGDRDAALEKSLRERLAEADLRIGAIDAELREGFPEFADLQQPAPLNVAAVQQRLGEGEVLLFFADTTRLEDTPGETYLWAIPKAGEARWVRLPRETGELAAAVGHLRERLGVGAEVRGAASLAVRDNRGPAAVLEAAYEIFGATLGPVADMIAGKRLTIVPSKRLAGLPFHLLVSERLVAGSDDPYRDAAWVARDHAITMLPSVASLTGAQTAATPEGRTPYLGFANPLLSGRSGTDRRAFDRQDCRTAAMTVADAGGEAMPALDALFRGGSADVEAVRALAPLPETTDEACAISEALGGDEGSVLLGARATEGAVKTLSEDGDLAAASILHFATHGLVSGELRGLAEPAIVLTPPDAATPEDDGLLTASEVATLKLDADWVILSACNTAAGDGGGEALSGLARAFFYAGARSLMVSHWPVDSQAAVRLATGTIGAMAADATVDRAEALRRAMVAEIERGGRDADPANWAPFVLVGRAR
ncbi:MAG: tetratricopeptide repeat protein [Rhizobiaceae bacterium]